MIYLAKLSFKSKEQIDISQINEKQFIRLALNTKQNLAS